jgi:hypothetical protein
MGAGTMHFEIGDLPNVLSLGAWTTHLIRPLFYLFRDDDVAPALASIIFIAALGLCAVAVGPSFSVGTTLRLGDKRF